MKKRGREKLSEIELLSEQIQQSWNLFTVGIIMVWTGFLFGLIMYYSSDRNTIFTVLLFTVGVTGVALMGLTLYDSNELSNQKQILIEERDQQRKDLIISMPCEILRLNTLSILETDQEQYIEDMFEWQDTYYNTKCETPLRSEVMKLQ